MPLSLNQIGKAISLVFCIILLFLGSDLADSIDDNNYQAVGVIDYITTNLNSKPIYNITTVPSGQLCPIDTEVLSLGNWTGTYVGCSKGFLGIYFGSCWLGTNIPGNSPVPLFQWNQTQFCVQRNQEYIFTSEDCSPGYQLCFQYFCVLVNESCPITKISNQTTINPGDIYADFEGEYLVFSNDTGYPIFTIQYTIKSPSPCYAIGWNPSDKNAYELAIENFNGCGFAGQDSSINPLAEMSEVTLYTENNLTNTINALPDYIPTISGDPVYLVTREIIQLSPTSDCHLNLYSTNQYLLPILQGLISYQDEIINFFEYEIFLVLVSLVFVLKKASKTVEVAYTVLTVLDIAYFIYVSSIISAQISLVTSFNMPYGPLYNCFSDVFQDAITNYGLFQQNFPSSIKVKIIIIFVILGLRNVVNLVVTLLGLRAARAKSNGKQKSVLSDLYSIFCICFALTGGDD